MSPSGDAFPEAGLDRHVLPVRRLAGRVPAEMDRRDQQDRFPGVEQIRPPQGAPNVLLVMLDDVGFGTSSAFGGPCRTPTIERLNHDGAGYTRFHTTALCSPTRAATLTGRNHHSVGMGVIAEMGTRAPGYTGMRPDSSATIARVLRGNGYATGAFGKMHQTPPWETTAAGPFDRWPTEEGFDSFYGFLGAEADHFTPVLYDGRRQVDPPRTPEEGYHLTEDLVDHAVQWVENVSAVAPDMPWFCYLPLGAVHAPLHVPESYRDRYAGEFDDGWDALRERTLARQKELGVVPEDTELGPWAPGLPHWDELDDDEKKVAARLMELYAGFLEHTDDQVGRLIDHLDSTGALENTLVLYMVGDNGASTEGGRLGAFNYLAGLNGLPSTTAELLAKWDDLGGPDSYPHFPSSWALALNTPYQWAKQVASHYGGTRNALVAHWPGRIAEPGRLRHQWHHCVDIAPTVLEAAGLPMPHTVDGVAQKPLEGVGMTYTFDQPDAPDRHTTQYFEIFGNRGIYDHGWTAVTAQRAPWLMATSGVDLTPLADSTWELYDTRADWSQSRDLAAEHPEILERLKMKFIAEAARYDVLPLDDSTVGRQAGVDNRPPHPMGGRSSITLYPHMDGLNEKAAPKLLNRAFRLTASLEVHGGDSTAAGSCEGVLLSLGGRFGGMTLYVLDGVPVFEYNFFGRHHGRAAGSEPLAAGTRTVELEFAYDGGIAAGADLRLLVDGEQMGQGRIAVTAPAMFSMNETLDIGRSRGSAVSTAYEGSFPVRGATLHYVQVDLGRGSELPQARRDEIELATH
ncbi:arylsulfatase [Dietzia kunjamensis]|uniref:arylsulfatase n=1 Tax=Dietzia kunjamensis TaxID=322509 RepID=UPI002DBDDD33|nr:arylsulfatase [Dietzia kunjamensis]MEB8327259.1 arylsulfatase [Dietzia kunjamensis]